MPSENRSPPTEFNMKLKVDEARYTLRKLVTTIGIDERHAKKFDRGMVKFEGSANNRKVKDDESNNQEEYGEEPENEIMDEIEGTEAIHRIGSRKTK